jgi:hypothetical protein
MKLRRNLVILAVLLTVGCAKHVSVPVPGSANSFDSDTYLSLILTDSLIQSTKADLANNSFPVTWVPNVKKALNSLIQAYDVANVSYQAYHTMAITNSATPAQKAAVQANLTNVQTATANLTAAKGGN